MNFEPILRRRLNLFGLDCDDSLRHLHFRNDRELNFFNNMLYQLQQLHDVLQKISQDEEKVFVSNTSPYSSYHMLDMICNMIPLGSCLQ